MLKIQKLQDVAGLVHYNFAITPKMTETIRRYVDIATQ